jgi:DNA-binding HxlR family transcriptional regulator
MANAAELLGDRWQLLILRSALYGVGRFEDMQRELKISRGILSKKLGILVDAGLLRRAEYQEAGDRKRTEYLPTEAARELFVVFAAMQQWGDKWIRRKPPMLRPVTRKGSEPLQVVFATANKEVISLDAVVMG